MTHLHIPDGWIDPGFLIITWMITLIVIVFSLRKMRDLDETRITYMAVLGGTIFAAQMLNFPIIGGTSGHLQGSLVENLPLCSSIRITMNAR